MQGNGGVISRDSRGLDRTASLVTHGTVGLDRGDSVGSQTVLTLLDPYQPKSAFLTQRCLSQGAGVSIIHPTLPRKPWYCFPNDLGTQPQRVKRLPHSASECLKIDLHFAFPRSTE